MEGAAFQKIARLDPAKLHSENGVQILVEFGGGEPGRRQKLKSVAISSSRRFTKLVKRPMKAMTRTWPGTTITSRSC